MSTACERTSSSYDEKTVNIPELWGQHIEPAKLMVGWNVENEKFVQPSVTKKLKIGQRVYSPDFGEAGRWYVQRLTDRTYWMICNAFATTVFVGNEGVLLIDASNTVVPKDMFEAIKQFTDLPVKAIVYSHSHTDHNGGTIRLKRALKKEGIELRIIASQSAAREISSHFNNVESPNEIIPDGRSKFQFEQWEFILGTPVVSAHNPADSYVLTPDGVIMYVDFNYPGRVPLAYISSSINITGWINFLRHVLGEEWQFANIGYKKDIEQTFKYLGELYDAYMTEIAPTWATGRAIKDSLETNGEGLTAGVFWGNYVKESSEIMARKVYPNWKHLPQSEVIRSHAYKVFEDSFLNYNPEVGAVRPDFNPIFPYE